MTALYIDGFDDGAYALRYNVTGSPSLVTGRLGTDSALQCGAGVQLLRAITASAQVFVGFGFQASAVGSASTTLLELFGDSGSTQHVVIQRTTTGAIAIFRGSTQVAISAASAVPASTWGFLEVSATISDTVGAVTVKWNGSSIVTFSGDTKNGGTATNIDAFRIGCVGASNQNQFDDLYVLNALGSVNNTFLGDSRVQTLTPTGAGNYTQLTPTGSATNWQNVDEKPYSTADYNGSATVGQHDTYQMADLASTTTSVKCVQETMVAHKSDAGTGNMKTMIRQGGTDYTDTAAAIGTAATWSGTLREQDPSTSAAWTVSGVNSLEAGAEVA